MTLSTHVLDTERGRPAAGVRVELYDAAGALVGDGVTDEDGRIRELADDLGRHLPHRLPSAVAVLQAGRARGRARRRPPPRPAAHLVLRVRELPRQLTAEQLAELFEGRTRFVERLAALDDPLGQAREVAPALSESEQKEVLDAHPAIGGKATSARSAREQGTDDDPGGARRAGRAEPAYEERFGFRFVVFVNRRPRREIVPILAARLQRTRERGAGRRRSTSSCRSRSIAGAPGHDARRRALRLLVGLGRPALPLAARDRRDGLDRRVVLLHRARQPPRAAEGPARRGARRRRRGVGGARRRLLPRREVPASRRSGCPSRCTGSSGRRTRRGSPASRSSSSSTTRTRRRS